jgi:hypothetical protein
VFESQADENDPTKKELIYAREKGEGENFR